MASSVNLTNLASNLGNYYRENATEVFTDILLGVEESIERVGISVAENVKDEQPLPNLIIGNLIKPGGNENFVPSVNTINFNSRTLKVRPIQADIKIVPQQFEATYLSTIRKSKGTYTKDNFPFYEFLAKEIGKKISKELRDAIWKAVYNQNGTDWTSVMDGFLQMITVDVAAGNIVEVITGAVTPSNVIGAIEDTVSGLGDGYKDIPGKCVVSRSLFDWYIKAPESVSGRTMGFNEMSGGTNMPGQAQIYVRGTNIQLVHESSFGSSQRIVACTGDNMWVGTDVMDEYNNIRVQEFDRTLKLMIDCKFGVQYALANSTNKPISVNDQP